MSRAAAPAVAIAYLPRRDLYYYRVDEPRAFVLRGGPRGLKPTARNLITRIAVVEPS